MQYHKTSKWITPETTDAEMVEILGLKQSEENSPNGSSYAAIKFGGHKFSDDFTVQVDANNGVFSVTVHPRTKRHTVDYGAHYACGGGAFLDGVRFTVREMRPKIWITLYGEFPWRGSHRNNRDVIGRRPLGDGERIPDGWEPSIVYQCE